MGPPPPFLLRLPSDTRSFAFSSSSEYTSPFSRVAGTLSDLPVFQHDGQILSWGNQSTEGRNSFFPSSIQAPPIDRPRFSQSSTEDDTAFFLARDPEKVGFYVSFPLFSFGRRPPFPLHRNRHAPFFTDIYIFIIIR